MTEPAERSFANARFDATDFNGATFHQCAMNDVRILGCEITALRIDGFAGEIDRLVVNDEARPPLAEVMAVRAERMTQMREVLAAITDEQLAETRTAEPAPGWGVETLPVWRSTAPKGC